MLFSVTSLLAPIYLGVCSAFSATALARPALYPNWKISSARPHNAVITSTDPGCIRVREEISQLARRVRRAARETMGGQDWCSCDVQDVHHLDPAGLWVDLTKLPRQIRGVSGQFFSSLAQV